MTTYTQDKTDFRQLEQNLNTFLNGIVSEALGIHKPQQIRKEMTKRPREPQNVSRLDRQLFAKLNIRSSLPFGAIKLQGELAHLNTMMTAGKS